MKKYYGVKLHGKDTGIFDSDKQLLLDKIDNEDFDENIIELNEDEKVSIKRSVLLDLKNLRYQLSKYSVLELVKEVIAYRNDETFQITYDFLSTDEGLKVIQCLLDGHDVNIIEEYVLRDVDDKGQFFLMKENDKGKLLDSAIEVDYKDMVKSFKSNGRGRYAGKVCFTDDEIEHLFSGQKVNEITDYFDKVEVSQII